MSSKRTAGKAVVVAVALAASGLVAGQASAANTTTHALTAVTPATLSTAGGDVVLSGKGFTSGSTVAFSGGTCTGGGVLVPFGSSGTKLTVSAPTGCTAGDKPSITVTTGGAVSTPLVGKLTFVAPVGVGAATFVPTGAPSGASFVVNGLTSLPSSGVTATLGGKSVANVKVVDSDTISGKVPGGLAPGAHDLVIASSRVASAAKAGFTVLSSIKVSPNVFVAGDAAPLLKIDGLGFKPSTTSLVRVTICGVPAVVSTAKPYTNTTIYATAPTFAAAAASPGATHYGDVDTTAGGLCKVIVRVDPTANTTYDGTTLEAATLATDDVVSVHTATSGIVYSAF